MKRKAGSDTSSSTASSFSSSSVSTAPTSSTAPTQVHPSLLPLLATFSSLAAISVFTATNATQSESDNANTPTDSGLRIALASIAKASQKDAETTAKHLFCIARLVQPSLQRTLPFTLSLDFGHTTSVSDMTCCFQFASSAAPKPRKKGTGFKAPKISKKAQVEAMKLLRASVSAFSDILQEISSDISENEDDPYTRLLQQFVPASFSWDEPRQQATPLPSQEKMTLTRLLANIKELPFYHSQIETSSCWETLEKRDALFGTLTTPLSPALTTALSRISNVSQFYLHQADAINAIESGENVMVSTSTASGKTLVYQIPIVRHLEASLHARAIFFFPTKALAQDQKRSLTSLLMAHDTISPHMNENQYLVSTFDGDTPTSTLAQIGGKRHDSVRTKVLQNGRVLFTNFDMLHKSLSGHSRSSSGWPDILQNLKMVVVDELHYYSGAFGAHAAYVMRRLVRLCKFYGNDRVQFVCCSATISNAEEHMKAFFGINQVHLIQQDGSPSGRKHLIVWNPAPLETVYGERSTEPALLPVSMNENHVHVSGIPQIVPSENQLLVAKRIPRVPSIQEAAQLSMELLNNGIRFLCFTKTRNGCELLLQEIHRRLEKNESMKAQVMSYRGGYSPHDRRDIEARMFSGQLLGIVATNALELGIDVGSLDVVLHLGFPYTIASYRQQAGRAGRRREDSASIMIADGFSGTDQHYVAEPATLFYGTPDTMTLSLHSRQIMNLHAQCAAAEIPISSLDLESLLSAGVACSPIQDEEQPEDEPDIVSDPDIFLRWDPNHAVYFPAAKYNGNPASTFQIRTGADEDCFESDMEYRVIDVATNRDVEAVEANRSFFTLYDGAIFIHQGQSFKVLDVCNVRRVARVRKTTATYITRLRDFTLLDPSSIAATSIHSQQSVQFGEMKATFIGNGYHILHPITGKLIDTVDTGGGADSQNSVINYVRGVWVDNVGECIATELRRLNLDLDASIHAAGHALLRAVLESGVVDRNRDKSSVNAHCRSALQSGPKRLALFTPPYASAKVPSNALIQKSFVNFNHIVRAAISILEGCNCSESCPRCVTLMRTECPLANEKLNRNGGLLVLKTFLL